MAVAVAVNAMVASCVNARRVNCAGVIAPGLTGILNCIFYSSFCSIIAGAVALMDILS